MPPSSSSSAQPGRNTSRTPSNPVVKQSNSTTSTPLLSPGPQQSTFPSANGTPTSSGMTMGQYVSPTNGNNNPAAFLQGLNLPFGASNVGGDGADDPSSLWNFATPEGGTATFPFGNSASTAQMDGQSGGIGGILSDSINGARPNVPSDATNTSNFNAFLSNNSGNEEGNLTTTNADQTPSTSMLSTSRPSGSQLPTHVAKNNPFLNKLRSMVDDPKTNDLICWSDDGETFLVPNHVRFGDEVLPRFFKHNRFSSFVRQLNMYGFHKVPHLQQGALKSDPGQDTELWEFRNDNFKRDRPELLLHMQRKKGVRVEDEGKEVSATGKGKDGEDGAFTLDAINGALTRAQRGEGDAGMLQLASVWSAIQAIQSAQQGINDNLRHLHNTNNDLWREAAEQRSRSKKQEETINKMLRFLAGIFGAQDGNNIGTSDRHHQHRRSDTQTPSSSSGSSSGHPFVRNYDKSRRRLLIGDGSSQGGQIEELEVPPEEEVERDDATPQARITEARSGTNSPANTNSPEMHLKDLPGTTSGDKQAQQNGLPYISSEATSTPGGGRRISQQAGTQLLSALASGEAQSWLANLLGQQQTQSSSSAGVNPDSQSARTRDDNMNAAANGANSFKLDSQTLAALQSILAAGVSGDASGAGQPTSYFDNNVNQPSGANVNNAAPPWMSNALSPRAQPNQSADQTQQLTRLGPQQQYLQNVSQDASAVQNVLNALVQSLRLENNGTVAPAPQPSAQPNAQRFTETQNGDQRTPGTDASKVPSSAYNDNANPSSEVDMDSLLKEFFHDPSSSSEGPTFDEAPSSNGLIDDFDGQTPAFAFSPAAPAGNNDASDESAFGGKNTKSRKRKPDEDALIDSTGKSKTTRQSSTK